MTRASIRDGFRDGFLAVVESGEYWPVGATTPRRADVRIIAATNRTDDLRDDLRDRFVMAIMVPSLRDRDDLLEVAAKLLPEVSSEVGRPVELGADAASWVASAPWPGNIRQLRNTLLVAALYAEGSAIAAAHLARATQRQATEPTHRPQPDGAGYLTSAEAARYLGHRSPAAVLALVERGRLTPDGRRGPGGAYLWRRETLDRFVESSYARQGMPGRGCPADEDGEALAERLRPGLSGQLIQRRGDDVLVHPVWHIDSPAVDRCRCLQHDCFDAVQLCERCRRCLARERSASLVFRE